MRDCPAHPGPGFTAGDDTDSAVMEFQIKRCAGSDPRGPGDDPRDSIADYHIAPCE